MTDDAPTTATHAIAELTVELVRSATKAGDEQGLPRSAMAVAMLTAGVELMARADGLDAARAALETAAKHLGGSPTPAIRH